MRRTSQDRNLAIERLDERICLSFQPIFDSGLLSIVGTREDDIVGIIDDGRGTILVQDPTGGASLFTGVRKIVVDGMAGNDVVRFFRQAGPSALVPAEFHLGEGHDTLSVLATLQADARSAPFVDLDISAGGGDDAVLIGLLLPAVQKVREAAARLNVDLGGGNDQFQLNTEGVAHLDLDLSAGAGEDNVLIGLLLPAVQKVRDAAARMNVDLGGDNDVFQLNANGVEQVDLDLDSGAGEDGVLIGLLLPAVQKVRQAAAKLNVHLGEGNDNFQMNSDGIDFLDLDLDAGAGGDSILMGMLLPAVQKVRESAARINVDLGEGSDLAQLNFEGVDLLDLDLNAGGGDDGALIGLLLPAVQKVRAAAARMNVDLGEGNDFFQLNTEGLNLLDLDLTAGAGGDSVLIGMLLPAVQKVRQAAARMNVDLGEGNDLFQWNAEGLQMVDLDLAAGPGEDGVLIGLLLPAVQKVRQAAARMKIDLGEGADRLLVRTAGYDIVDIALGEFDPNDTIDI